MAFIHGKGTKVSLNAVDLSAFCNNVKFGKKADDHDVTTFGKNSHVYQGGLKDGETTLEGIYDDGASGPQATIEALIGTVVELIYQPEGVGTGKPTRTGDVLVVSYEESDPVDDMISFSVSLTHSDDMVTTSQA